MSGRDPPKKKNRLACLRWGASGEKVPSGVTVTKLN